MQRIRVIPVLLIQDGGLVKTVKFKNPKYVGDPINAVKIFNDKEVDEIVILDISATQKGYAPKIEIIQDIASEAFMPLAYGGGIRSLKHAQDLFRCGIEKVILNSILADNPKVISEIANQFGSQSIVVSIDAKKNIFGKYAVFAKNGSHKIKFSPWDFAKQMEALGAGEIIINSIDREGTFSGYDLELIRKVADAVSIPVVANGGASSTNDFSKAVREANASAVAAGSMFVFQRPHRAVLISYPSQEELKNVLLS